jgi:hypothetical protein
MFIWNTIFYDVYHMNRIKNSLIGVGLMLAGEACSSGQARLVSAHQPAESVKIYDTPKQNDAIIESMKLKRDIETTQAAFAGQVQKVCDLDKEERKAHFSKDVSITICNDQKRFVRDTLQHCSPDHDFYLASCEVELAKKRAEQLKSLSAEEVGVCRYATYEDAYDTPRYSNKSWQIDYGCMDATSARRLPDFTSTKQIEADCLTHQKSCIEETGKRFAAAACSPDAHFTFHTEEGRSYNLRFPSLDVDHVVSRHSALIGRDMAYGLGFNGVTGYLRERNNILDARGFDYGSTPGTILCLEQDYRTTKLKESLSAATEKIKKQVPEDAVTKCTVADDANQTFQTACLEATAYRSLPAYPEYMKAKNDFAEAVNTCAGIRADVYKVCEQPTESGAYGSIKYGTANEYQVYPFFAAREKYACK